MKPAKPAVALLKDIGEAGKHNHFTEEVGAEVITVAEGHNKSQPSGCLLDTDDNLIGCFTLIQGFYYLLQGKR
ncbi:hypothetical protein [Klebsiella sp. PL-2018]|uniref:hypothetical protein n=1 Tax=Klebsiella sp. PL-2018 TaxID=2851540 RepID=UPI001C21E183|nr:hypothetical protein [Klebsiella sp. PL-2018]